MPKTQSKVVRGWVLKFEDKYWGEVYPEDRGHGGGCAIKGWTDNLSKIDISVRDSKPPNKGWFTYQGNTSDLKKMNLGDWVLIDHTTTVAVEEIK